MSDAGIDAERRSFNRWALAPSLVVLFLIAALPALYLLVTSLTPFQLVNPGSATDFSAPLRNYRLLPGDPRFVNSLLVQAKLSFWGVLFQVLLGFQNVPDALPDLPGLTVSVEPVDVIESAMPRKSRSGSVLTSSKCSRGLSTITQLITLSSRL